MTEWVRLTIDIKVEVSDSEALREAAFLALRRAIPGEDGVEPAVTSGDNTAAALGGYVAATPGSVHLVVPGVASYAVRQVQSGRIETDEPGTVA